jgi:GNAT superfamily N-acetyltransferase
MIINVGAKDVLAAASIFRDRENDKPCMPGNTEFMARHVSDAVEKNAGVVLLNFDEAANKILGGIAAFKQPSYVNPDIVYCSVICLFVKEKGKGQGETLLTALEEWGKENGCNRITMRDCMHKIDEKIDSCKEMCIAKGYTMQEVTYCKEI